jgi:hypothetical protein
LSSRLGLCIEFLGKSVEYNFICTITKKIVLARRRLLRSWIRDSDRRVFCQKTPKVAAKRVLALVNGELCISFPGSARERTAVEALPRFPIEFGDDTVDGRRSLPPIAFPGRARERGSPKRATNFMGQVTIKGGHLSDNQWWSVWSEKLLKSKDRIVTQKEGC